MAFNVKGKSHIVNDPSNLPVTIVPVKMEELEKKGVRKQFFIDLLVNERNGLGVIRDKYFMITVDGFYSVSKLSNSFLRLGDQLALWRGKNVQFIMIKF